MVEENLLYCTDFENCYRFLEIIKELYKDKDFESIIWLVEENLPLFSIQSEVVLSDFYDMIGKVLWKMKEYKKAFGLWEKAFLLNKNNRHSYLCLKYYFFS